MLHFVIGLKPVPGCARQLCAIGRVFLTSGTGRKFVQPGRGSGRLGTIDRLERCGKRIARFACGELPRVANEMHDARPRQRLG
jgi:hypothetical protein